MDISLPSDVVHKFADQLSAHLLCTVAEVRRLFLVEDMVDTLKVHQNFVYVIDSQLKKVNGELVSEL